MIIGIEGGLGSGKTLIMAKWLTKDSNQLKRDVYANFKLYKCKAKPLMVTELLDKKINLTNASIGIDELTVFADCRVSMSQASRLFSYFILQTRKRNVCLYYTTQNFGMIDKRILRHTHIMVFCSKVKNADHLRHYEIVDCRDGFDKAPSNFVMDIRKYFNYFNTDEIINPFEMFEE